MAALLTRLPRLVRPRLRLHLGLRGRRQAPAAAGGPLHAAVVLEAREDGAEARRLDAELARDLRRREVLAAREDRQDARGLRVVVGERRRSRRGLAGGGRR